MKNRVVAVKTAPNKISIEFQNGTVWEYEKGEVSYTEWTLGKPTDWFIPNELDFLKKINRYLEEAIQYKNLTSWQKVATHMVKQRLMNKTFPNPTPKKSKQYLIVFPDDTTYIRKGPYLYPNVPNYKPNRIHQVNLSYPNQFKKFRGMQFDHVLFINCDESFLPPELQVTMYHAKLTYVK